jgi:hypothetical protein
MTQPDKKFRIALHLKENGVAIDARSSIQPCILSTKEAINHILIQEGEN